MRELLLAVVVLLAGAAGCLGTEDDEKGQAPPLPPQDGDEEDRGADEDQGTDDELVGQAPSLSQGTSFTYGVDGVYNHEPFTIVVASNNSDGYLFAGETTEDLLEEIINDRPWQGTLDASLNPLDGDGQTYWNFFDWPLEDGKTWTFSESGREVTAERAEVVTPDGPSEGFRMQGSLGEDLLEYTYAPEVGYITSLEWGLPDRTFLDVTLEAVGETTEAVWFEFGSGNWVCGGPTGSDPISTLEVPESVDAVVAGSGSVGEGEFIAQPPASPDGSEPYVEQHEAEEDWVYEELPPRSGTWEMTARSEPSATSPGTYLCGSLRAVTWTSPLE